MQMPRAVALAPTGGMARQAVLALMGLAVAFPFYWMLSTSVRTELDATAFPPHWLPQTWELGNYAQAWRAAPFGRYFLNSGVVSCATAALAVLSSTLAAYAFARLRFPGRGLILALFLGTMLIPPEVTLIPNFITITRLHLSNTYPALILPYAANMFSVLLLRQAFRNLPRELDEAAILDGCNRWQMLWRVAVPLVRPALGVVALLAFLRTWNDFLWPLVVTTQPAMRTVQVGLSVFTLDASVQYPLLMAASTMVVTPIIVLFLFTQRQFIEGVARSGLRG